VRVRKHILTSIAVATVLLGVWPARADAQWRRGPRRVVVAGGYYDPFFAYDPWFGYYGYPYGPYPYPYYGYDPGSSVRVEVKPKDAEVYVDGYYAGVVDDFDGVFQRLPVYPGEHEIELYLDGYRPVKQKVYTAAGRTFKLKYEMAKLGAGEQAEPRPEPPNPPPTPQATAQPPAPRQPGTVGRGPARRMPPQSAPGQPGAQRPDASAFGSISIRVQPADADILVDGDKWRGPDSQDRLIIEVAEGRHTIEVQKAGFRTYITEIDVRRGDTTNVNVSLRTQNND
jgi:PEGA domain-containing protein